MFHFASDSLRFKAVHIEAGCGQGPGSVTLYVRQYGMLPI